MDNAPVNETAPAQNVVKIQIEIQADPTVNYASYQNNVPLVRSLTLTNATDEPLRDVKIVVRCEPAFADTMRLQFERLDARETRRLDALDLKFQHRYLAELNEAERGRVIVEVNVAGTEIVRFDHAIDVLAYDQWAGTRALPELLAAFSLPNNPAVDRLIFQAGELLAKSGSGRTMNGYQSKNREDVWAQSSAIYSAVKAANLHYSEPSASFGADGQKIRTPDRILWGGVAILLDEDVRVETPQGRLTRWKSKLTLRNRMINFRPIRTTLPLRVPDPAHWS